MEWCSNTKFLTVKLLSVCIIITNASTCASVEDPHWLLTSKPFLIHNDSLYLRNWSRVMRTLALFTSFTCNLFTQYMTTHHRSLIEWFPMMFEVKISNHILAFMLYLGIHFYHWWKSSSLSIDFIICCFSGSLPFSIYIQCMQEM